MKLVLILALITINLVTGNIIPKALGLVPSESTSDIGNNKSQSEVNCTAPFTAVGSSCLNFVTELEIDHEESTFVCDLMGGHLVTIDTPTKLQEIVNYINSNNLDSFLQSYWIDGVNPNWQDGGKWSFENTNAIGEFPLGTPFWSSLVGFGDCLTIASQYNYYFTPAMCTVKTPSPICEQNDESAHDGTRGTIESPSYPHNYPSNARNEWSVTTEENATITVTFEAFNTESGYDYLTISDGADSSAPDLLRLSGNHAHTSISEVTSSGNSLHFRFTSDSSVTRTGFKLNWVASSAPSEIIDVTCPPFYTAVGQDCFAFVFAPMAFNEARITCASMNGQLGVVSNAEQLRSLYLYIEDQGVSDESFWLGGSDQTEEGHFVYLDGSDVPEGTPFWNQAGASSGSQEPDGSENENCVALLADGAHFLSDVECQTEISFLCSPI